MNTANTPVCQVCHTSLRANLRRGIIVRPAVAQLIQGETGHWDENLWICLDDLQRFQQQYVRSLLADEQGELSRLDKEVLQGLKEHEILSRNPEIEIDSSLTFGQRLADRITDFGGSWSFIIFFVLVLLGWMTLNSWMLLAKPFDPYPYILVNLKAELEIRQLHQKIDHMLTHQWERLVEIQEVQMELINEVRRKR